MKNSKPIHIKKIDLNPEKRLKEILIISEIIFSCKSLKRSKELSNEIWHLANTKLLKNINKGIEVFKQGRYISIEEFFKKSPINKFTKQSITKGGGD